MAKSKPETFRDLGVKTAKRGTIYLATEIITSLISLLILVYLARQLQPVEFGLYTIAIAFSQVLYIVGNFGIGPALRKKIPESLHKSEIVRKVIVNGYFIALVISAIAAIAGVSIGAYLALYVYKSSALLVPIELAAVASLFSVLMNIEIAGLVGLGKVTESAILNFVYTISQLVFVIIAVGILGYGLTGATAAYLIACLLGTVAGLYYTERAVKIFGKRPDGKSMREIATFSAPLLVSNIVDVGITNFAVIYLAIFASAAIIGNYGAAFKFGSAVNIMFTSSAFIALPAFSYVLSNRKMKKEIEKAYNASIYYMMLFVMPFVAFVIAASVPIMHLLVSSTYTTAPIYLSLMVLGLALGIIGGYASNLLIGIGQTTRLMKYQIATVILDLVFLFLLVPRIGAYGAIASVFFVDTIFGTVIYARLMHRDFGIRTHLGELARMAVASIVILVVMYGITQLTGQAIYSIVIDAVVGVLLYPPLLAIVGAIDRENIEFVREAGRSMKGVSYFVNKITDYAAVFTSKD